MNDKICFISTVYDPDGKLLDISRALLPKIKSLYDEIVIKTTSGTDEYLVDLIGMQSTASIESNHKDGIANGRRLVLRSALSVSTCDTFHMCDLDRILWWYTNYPKELKRTIERLRILKGKFVIIGRTEQALISHPWLQYETEKIISKLFSQWYGHNVDVVSGSRGIPRQLAKDVLYKSSTENGAALDVEWPLLVGKKNIVSFDVNGLGYESEGLGIRKDKETEIVTRINNLNEAVRIIRCLT